MRFHSCVRFLNCLLCVVLSGGAGACGGDRLPESDPASVGISESRLAVIDDLVHEGLRDKKMPGAVVVVGYQGKIVHRQAYGMKQIEPAVEPMTIDTVFDLASLTKPIATGTSVMQLVETGRVELDEPVVRYLPEFANHDKEKITVRHLLTHTGGLIADNPISDFAEGRQKSIERLMQLKPLAAPGDKFIYSDVGFMVLGELVAQVSGQPLDQYTRQHVFEPLAMNDTMYCPSPIPVERLAPTEQRDGHWMRGEVHDPRAFALGGVAGHAGLFSTADDLARYAQAMLSGGKLDDGRILKPESVAMMTSSQQTPGGVRGLGWDKKSGYSINRGDLMSSSACGHGGFTGTALWFDPDKQIFVIFLSHRVHPKGDGAVNPLIGRICTVAVAAIREFE